MKLLVYTSTAGRDLHKRLGQPEYSYRFVIQEFRPLLDQIGSVIDISDPATEVDAIYEACRARGEACVFLCFMPPNKVPLGLACPTIPVFAWEYEALPSQEFNGKPRNDWVRVLNHFEGALTHSSFTVERARSFLGRDYPIASVPAPLWDRVQGTRRAALGVRRIRCNGLLIDSREVDLAQYRKRLIKAALPGSLPLPASTGSGPRDLLLDGVVYTAVFNPCDGRKNWRSMIGAFCEALRDKPDATLVFKLTHYDPSEVIPWMLETVYRMGPIAGRIVFLHAYLDPADYEALLSATTFALNASHGEGQCLPLMEYMSAGKVAIAPCHTSMRDYVDEECAFVVDSSEEIGSWPHDPRQTLRTLRHRIHHQSLVSAFRKSYYVATREPAVHAAMSRAAVESLRRYCSMDVVGPRLVASIRERLARVPLASVG
ncbi:glycosyltransferase [Dyella sp. ASV21]|uniref:glycosyltransferase n=1 Tax=Dyella sp. ASV21 TaxID=2795114 RepID=UPI0018EDAF15|nr:glycosyltransferase [Dyella sp. ASV21]